MPKTSRQPGEYISPLNINRLQGRILRTPMPAGKNREILFVYGHHASLERYWGIIENLADYGAVTMPDLPGFGGMDTFYKIGKEPTLDNLADYLATVIKLRYGRKRFTIIGLSFGFLLATRMLQRYPDIAKRVDLLVSVVGFTHSHEFTFNKRRMRMYKLGAEIFKRPLPAAIFKNMFLQPFIIKAIYAHTHNAKHKFKDLTPEERERAINFEVHLWRCNEVRTYMNTTLSMLHADNCRKKINLPVYHLSVKNDNYFDNQLVEQHMKIVFTKFTNIPVKLNGHSVSVIANKKEAQAFMPLKLKQLLSER